MKKHYFSVSRRSQQGVVLIMALITLVLITLITVASMRSVTMDERMAGAARDRNKAFQAAEFALRTCLEPLIAGTYEASPNPVALTPAAAPNPPVWEVATNWTSASRQVTVDILDARDLAEQPRCIFETMGAGTGSYRVTARALGAQDTTAVILQATFSNE
jgi:type IV pilus assembly protein PilX